MSTDVPAWTDDQIEFIHQLERLAGMVVDEPGAEFRDLIREILGMKRAAVREGHAADERVAVQDVLGLGAELGKDFPQAQRGCEVFVSSYFIEKTEAAPFN